MNGMKGRKAVAILIAVVTLASAFAMCGMSDSDATDGYWTYTININDASVAGSTPIGLGDTDTSRQYTSNNGDNVGSWGFDSGGYGPFGSFYAAFDPAQDNKMICHLDPNDLKKSVDGNTDITGSGYNVMWCLPTVYWSTDSSGNLVLTNDPSKGTAYAHTIDGITYPYLAIGVYEASEKRVNGSFILTSESGGTVLKNVNRSTFRGRANNQLVDTDGEGTNGHAMLWNFYQYELYKYCALAVMGSWDSQAVAGGGYMYGNSSVFFTGKLDASGPYAGSMVSYVDSNYKPVKVFIENAWGSLNEFVDGIIFDNNGRYCIDQSSVPDDSTSEGDYKTILSEALPVNVGGSGSDVSFGSDPSTKAEIWGMPTAANGSQTSGLYDELYTKSGTLRTLAVGGYTRDFGSYSLNNGLSYVFTAGGVEFASRVIGGRLAFVFDVDPAPSTHTVTFISDGQTTTRTVSDGEAVAAPVDPSIPGKVFGGWYTSSAYTTRYDFDTPVTSDIRLYARWYPVLVFTSNPATDGTLTFA